MLFLLSQQGLKLVGPQFTMAGSPGWPLLVTRMGARASLWGRAEQEPVVWVARAWQWPRLGGARTQSSGCRRDPACCRHQHRCVPLPGVSGSSPMALRTWSSSKLVRRQGTPKLISKCRCVTVITVTRAHAHPSADGRVGGMAACEGVEPAQGACATTRVSRVAPPGAGHRPRRPRRWTKGPRAQAFLSILSSPFKFFL